MISSSHFFKKQLFFDDNPESIQGIGPWNRRNSYSKQKRIKTDKDLESVQKYSSERKSKILLTSRSVTIAEKSVRKKISKKGSEKIQVTQIIPPVVLPPIIKTPIKINNSLSPKQIQEKKLKIFKKKQEAPSRILLLEEKLNRAPEIRQSHIIKQRKQIRPFIKNIAWKIKKRNYQSEVKHSLFLVLSTPKTPK